MLSIVYVHFVLVLSTYKIHLLVIFQLILFVVVHINNTGFQPYLKKKSKEVTKTYLTDAKLH